MKQRTSTTLFLLVLLLGAAYVLASRMGIVDRVEARLRREFRGPLRLSPGDFPAGVSAPVGELAAVPLRPTLIGFVPNGAAAGLLVASGGLRPKDAAAGTHRDGLFKTAYALDARAVAFGKEDELRKALANGGENGGVDLAAVTVDRLAFWAHALRDAAPRTVMLIGRSRGQDALGAVGVSRLADLRGKRLAVYPNSPDHFFALWLLSRAGMTLADVQWVELNNPLEAGTTLREGRCDAVVGLRSDVEAAAKERGGGLIASTADAPHLIATVLVARGEFAARYPDAIRRALRGLLDAGQAVARDPAEAAVLLGEAAPHLGDPTEAIKNAPPATMKDNLGFFGLAGEAPVTYDELFRSAAALAVKTGKLSSQPDPEDTRDLGALKYVAEARGF